MNKDVIYPSMVIKAQEETINKLEDEVNKQAKAIQIYEKELKKCDNNWNELKKWLNEPQITYNLDASEFGIEKIECVSIKDTLNKIKELESK